MKNGRIQLQRCGVRGSADGAARLEDLESRVLMSLTLPPMPTILRNTPAQSVVAADFDGDGLTDLAASRANTLAFFRGRADGTFEPAVQTTLPANVGLLAAGRFDGSGRAGVASIMQVQGAGGADVGLLVRVLYLNPATGLFAVGARLRVGDAASAGAIPRIGAGNFMAGWRDEIVVGIGSATDVLLLRLPDKSTLVQETVLLSDDRAVLRAMVVGTGLPGAAAGRAQVVSVVGETFANTVVVTTVGGDSQADVTNRPVGSIAGGGGASVAVGDVDGDGLNDVVVGAANGVAGGEMALLRAASSTAFAPIQPLEITANGLPLLGRVDFVGDVAGDGKADLMVTVTGYNRGSSAPLGSRSYACVQQSDGTFEAFTTGQYVQRQALGSYGLDGYAGMVYARVGAAGAPAAVQYSMDGLSIGVATEQLFGPVLFDSDASYDVGPDGLPLRTGLIGANAYDQDPMRGGHVVRVEFVFDLNRNGMVDDSDPVLAVVTQSDGSRFPAIPWNSRYTIPAEWAAGRYTLFARAIDNDGLASAWVGTEFDIYA